MVRATKAILYHSSQLYGLAHQQAVDRVKDGRHDNVHFYDHDFCPSSEEHRHQFCPIGMESWCKWQKDKAAGTKTYDPDKARIPHAIFHAVHDIIDSLSNRELLEQCSEGLTQMLYAHQQYILCIYYNVTCLERILSQHSLEPCPKSKASGTKTNSGCSQTGCSVVQSRNRSTDSSTRCHGHSRRKPLCKSVHRD